MSDLAGRGKRVLSPVMGHYTWLPIDRAEGSWLVTSEGRRVLDLTCGIAVTPVGHSHPAVVKAVTEQASKLMHISAGVAKYESNIALGEFLQGVLPAGIDTFMFQNSGAEAIEAAVKLARQATQREGIVVFRGGFHGRTTGAAALTTSKAAYRRGYGALLPEVHVAPFPYALELPIDGGDPVAYCLREIELMLEHEIPPENVAAFLIEPVLGEGGYVPAPASFLRGVRDIATRIGALLIADEIQTAFGRAGAWTAVERQGVVPDIVTLAKALGGGLPLGAVAAPRALHEKWPTGTHGTTFGGNPVSCAAGLATMRVIQGERLIERAERVGEIVVEELRPLARADGVSEVRRIGAMIAVEFADKARSKAAIAGALERDVLLISCGSHEQVVRFIPALNIPEADLRQGVRAFVEAARAARANVPA